MKRAKVLGVLGLSFLLLLQGGASYPADTVGPTPACAYSVSEITPVSGSSAGGTDVSIIGTCFDKSTEVTFGGLTAKTTFNNETSISAITPAHEPGSVAVVVVFGGLIRPITARQPFTYLAADMASLIYSGNGSDEGEAPIDPNSPYKLDEEAKVLEPGKLGKNGYSFTCWNIRADVDPERSCKHDEGGYKPGEAIKMDSDISLYAQWALNPAPSHTISFLGNGSTSGLMSPQTANAATAVTLNAFTRTGFTFTHWTTTPADDPVFYQNGWTYAFLEDATFYAQWSGIQYAITYDITGATSSQVGGDSIYTSGGAVTLPTGNPGRNGYSFTGWFLGNGDPVSTGYVPPSPFGAITFYAHWSILPTYTVTFHGNGATAGDMNPQTQYAPALLNINTYTRTGFTFNGWAYTGNGSVNYLDQDSYLFNIDLDLWAHWLAIPPVTHTVTFIGNGATAGTMAVQSHAGAAALTANSFTRTGYTFDEWNTVADASGTVIDEGGTYSFAANITLYAMWKLIYVAPPEVVPFQNVPTTPAAMHTITFLGNGATAGVVPSQIENSAHPVRENGFIRAGYVFHDWNSTSDHTGLEFDPGDIYSFASDLTLYAEWSLIPTYSAVITADSPLVVELLAGQAKSINVNIVGVANTVVSVTLDIPTGIVTLDGRVRITPISTPASLALGLVTLKVEILDSFGAVIPALLAPITMHFKTALGQTIVAKSDDGLIWTPIPLLTGTTLPAGQNYGYFIDATGEVVILASHLTQFGFKMSQVTPMTLTATTSSIGVDKKVTVMASGGTGSGAILITTISKVCSVSNNGIITTLARGDCWISAVKTGDGTYMQSNTAEYRVTITVEPLVISKVSGTNFSAITIDLGVTRTQTRVDVQVKLPNKKAFQPLGTYSLNKAGKIVIKKILSKGSVIRFLQDDKVVTTSKAIG